MFSNQLSHQDFDRFRSGVQQFNEQKFFECHETLEQIWLGHDGEFKEFLQGLIQLSVAYHHMLKGNQKGALKLLNRGLRRVAKYQPSVLNLALSDLCQSVQVSIDLLENGADMLANQAAVPKVRFL